jgi:hypothetical protein
MQRVVCSTVYRSSIILSYVSAGGIKIRKLTLCLYPASFAYRQYIRIQYIRQTSGDTRQTNCILYRRQEQKDRKTDKQFMKIKKEKRRNEKRMCVKSKKMQEKGERKKRMKSGNKYI